MITIPFVMPQGFNITSIKTASQFCESVLQPGTVDIPDVDDKRLYYRLHKEQNGRVSIGRGCYGRDPITAIPPTLTHMGVVDRVYAIRKHINRKLSN